MTDREFLFSKAVVTLLREVVSRGESGVWNTVTEQRTAIADYVAKLGLSLVVDEENGYAYLRQREDTGLPKLVRRMPLSFPMSLFLVMLRSEINEYDAAHGDSNLVLEKEKMVSFMRRYSPPVHDEVKFENRIDALIAKAVEMKFLEPAGGDEAYEVKPILRSFIDADFLTQFKDALEEYKKQLVISN